MTKAVRLHDHGGVEKIVIDELPIPSPAAGEILVKLDLRYVITKQLTIYGSTMESKSILFRTIELMLAGKFHAVIDTVLHYTEVRRGQEINEKRQQFGKVVLNF